MTTVCLDCPTIIHRGSRCAVHQRAYQNRRNAQRGGTGWVWQETRERILVRDGYRCREEGEHSGRLEIDHMIPLHQGGDGSDANLITRCHAHHNTKTRRER